MLLTPLTTLEAVNQILANDGEAPVASLDDSGFSEASSALKALERVNREVQTKGWAFNTDLERKFTPDVSDEIVLPTSTLWVKPVYTSIHRPLVERARKLYDLETNSYTFTGDVYLNICELLDFEECPSAARDYITIRAARLYQATSTGSYTQNSFTEADELRAEATMKAADLRMRPRGYFRTARGTRLLFRRPI